MIAETIKNAMVALHTAAGIDSSNFLIRAQQNAQRPARAFTTYQVLSTIDIHEPYTGPVDENGDVIMYVDRESTISLTCYGAGADTLCETLYNALYKQSTAAAITATGLVFVEHVTGINNVTQLLNNRFEPQFNFDILVRFVTEITDTVGCIEKIVGSGCLDAST